MKEFIVKLYENNNFPIYLGSIIGVLLIAFFVVFFLGKKDKKKIEMTQKLEQIDPNAFISQSQVIGVYGEGFDRLKVKVKKENE